MSDKELKLKGDQNFDDIRDIWERIATLEANQKTLNENFNVLEASYTHSMKMITASLERVLRRIRKLTQKKIKALEKKLNKAILFWSNYGDMADLIRNDNAKRISKIEEKLKNK